MFKKILLISIFLSFLINLAHAEEINSVIVDGNKRLSKESIIVFGNIIINNDYNDQNLNIILKDLYSTNFFQDINLSIKNNVLYIKVIENPIIEDLKINGISNKKLEETLLDLVQLKNRKSYIESTFTKDLTLIKNVVKSNGYYFAKVKTSIIKNKEKNSIKLIYDIDLGKKAKINFKPLQPGDVPATFADVSNFKADFDYAPKTSIDTGISDFIDWYKDYYQLNFDN